MCLIIVVCAFNKCNVKTTKYQKHLFSKCQGIMVEIEKINTLLINWFLSQQ